MSLTLPHVTETLQFEAAFTTLLELQ